VVVMPEGLRPWPQSAVEATPLEEAELGAMLRDLPRDPLGIDEDPEGVRLSLGGVQHKLVLLRLPSGRFAQPLGGVPSTCLLKPEHEQYEGLAINEAFCMWVAGAVGNEVARAEVLVIDGIRCLYVERFDRVAGAGGEIERLHQEDMCQALGVLPTAKYEADGGPSAAQVVELLKRDRRPRSALDVNVFLRALVTNFVLGNSDAHGKNYALLYDPGTGMRMAPLYDLVSTAVYPDLTPRMAMAIGGEDDPSLVDIESWRRLGRESGLGGGLASFVRRWSAEVLAAAERGRLSASEQGWEHPVLDAILAVCRERAARLSG